MTHAAEFIQQFIGKPLEITLSGISCNLHVIDWSVITAQHEEVMEQLEGMDDDAAGEFLCDHETALIQITECFMNDACDEKVEDERWWPIGLLGLNYPPNHYAETKNQGLLLLDLSKGEQNTPAVILFKNNKAQAVAPSWKELLIKEIK